MAKKTTATATATVEAINLQAEQLASVQAELATTQEQLAKIQAEREQMLAERERLIAERETAMAENEKLAVKIASLFDVRQELNNCKARGNQLLSKLGEGNRERLTVSIKNGTVKDTNIREFGDKLTSNQQKVLAFVAKYENKLRGILTDKAEWHEKTKKADGDDV